jgi:hypothetical protein
LDFKITHPFHPDRERELIVLHTRLAGQVRWLWYTDVEGQPRQVKESFTDRAEPDAFRRQAAGRCAFALQDLLKLHAVVERRRNRPMKTGET